MSVASLLEDRSVRLSAAGAIPGPVEEADAEPRGEGVAGRQGAVDEAAFHDAATETWTEPRGDGFFFCVAFAFAAIMSL